MLRAYIYQGNVTLPIAQVKRMEIGHTISRGVVIVTLSQWFDTAAAEEFLKYCATLPAGPVILDLSGLTYISSTGLRGLLQFGKDRREKGSDVVLAGTGGFVLSVIRMSGFDQLFLMYPNTAEALQAVAKPGT